MNRKLGITEFWFYQDMVNVIIIIDLKGELDVSLLEKALLIISEKHPTLRINFNEKEQSFKEIKEYKIRLLVSEISKSELFGFIEKELATDFDKGGETPLWRVNYLKFKDTKEQKIIITASHSITDGSGAFILTNDILKYMDQLKNNKLEEIVPLKMLKATEEIVFSDITLDKERLNEMLKNNVENDQLIDCNTFIPMEFKETDINKRKTSFLIDESTPEEFENVKKKLKEEKVTFGAFLTASAFFVMKKLYNIEQEFSIDIDVNYRDRFKEKLGYKNLGNIIGIFEVEKKVKDSTKFWDFCRDIKSDIQSKLDDHSGAYWLEFYKTLEIDQNIHVDKLYGKVMDNYGRYGDLNLSNIGNYPFPKKYGDLELNSLHCLNGEVPVSYSFLWYIISIDKLCFSMAYESSLFSKDYANHFFSSLNEFVKRSNQYSSDATFEILSK